MTKTKLTRGSTKNKWGIPLLVAIVIGLAGAGYYTYMSSQAQNNDGGSVDTATIGTGDIILTATGIGTLIPSEEVAFGFNNDGKISEVYVSLGDHVEAGQVLARLESTTLELKYKQAESNLAALTSPAEIAKAEQTVQDAKLSFATARNDLQYLIGPDMLYTEEKVAEAQERLDLAKAEAEKDASDANKQNVLDAESALAKARGALNYVYYAYSSDYTVNTFTYPIRNDNGITVRKELIAPTDAEVSAARAAYELAKANLKDAQNYLDVLKGNKTPADVTASSITSLTEAELAYEQAKADLEATELMAPISGTITSINLNAGEDVEKSVVVTISNLGQPYVVETLLDETDWDKAKVGFAASVIFDLLPDKTYSGTITRVYPTLDDSSGTSMVRILVTLDGDTAVDLPSGASVSVDVTGGEALDTVLVPISALREMENGRYTVKVLKNGEFVEQEVEIGLQDILYAEVKSGLQTGDVVLTDATINE